MNETAQRGNNGLGRWAIAVLLAGVAVCYALGLQDYFNLNSLARNHDMLATFVARHLVLAVLTYMATYIAIAVLSIPGAAILSVVGGYLFGWMISAPVTLVAASTGALITFQIVKTSLGEALARRAGPYVSRLITGFREDAFSYLLFLRLVPAFPFFAVNAVAGLARIELKTFLGATLLGMIPGALVFGIVGGGLADTMRQAMESHAACLAQKPETDCLYDISAVSLLTPQLLTGFVALGVLALVPVFLKKWKRHEI